jgi:dTMP kinase
VTDITNLPSGRFITLEGGEGAGKSTQAKELKNYLERKRKKVLLTREPGGSFGAEQLRNLLVSGDENRWDPVSETLLLYAARRDHWIKTIRPSLETGVWVISDRFSDSTMVYQGFGKGLDLSFIEKLHQLTLGEKIYPDLTLVLDISAQLGLERSLNRDQQTQTKDTRFENMNLTFHQRLRSGFQEVVIKNPNRVFSINAEKPVKIVTAEIISIISQKFETDLSK